MNIKFKLISLGVFIILLFSSLTMLSYAKPQDNTSWYYNQLSIEAKEFYNLLKEIEPEYSSVSINFNEVFVTKEHFYSFCANKVEAFYQAVTALSYDRVDMYWLKKEYRYNISSSSMHPVYNITLTLHYKVNPNFKADFKKIEDEYLNVIKSMPVYGQSRYEKLKSIYEYLCQSITYTYGKDSYTSYAALVEKKAVCEGYAKAFKAVCDYYNIPCVLVSGYAVKDTGAENHMWNYVLMEDGKWYAVDPTWGDQSNSVDYDYFLVGSDTMLKNKRFSSTHIPKNEVANYTISTSTLQKDIKIKFQHPNLSSTEFLQKKPDTIFADDNYLEVFNAEDLELYDDTAFFLKSNQKISSLFNQNSSFEYSVYDKDSFKLKPDDILKNGSKILIYKDGVQIKTFCAIIKGDIDANGKITACDARLTLRAASKLINLDDDEFLAADTYMHKNITAASARQILRVASRLDCFSNK